MTTRDRLLPWSGLVLGSIGWAVSSQWGSWRTNDACLSASPVATFLLGTIGLVVVLVGAWLSSISRNESQTQTTRFIANMSLAADVVFALAIVFHTVSTLIIPRCFS